MAPLYFGRLTTLINEIVIHLLTYLGVEFPLQNFLYMKLGKMASELVISCLYFADTGGLLCYSLSSFKIF